MGGVYKGMVCKELWKGTSDKACLPPHPARACRCGRLASGGGGTGRGGASGSAHSLNHLPHLLPPRGQ